MKRATGKGDLELRPIPILEGKSAERFYRNINNKKISKEQKEFIDECVEIFDKFSN